MRCSIKIGSFAGLVPSIYLPQDLTPALIGELVANLIGFAAKESRSLVPLPQFSFLLTAQPSSEGLSVGLTCHVRPFYESYRNLLTLFFSDPPTWKTRVDALPAKPRFEGRVHIGEYIPHLITASGDVIRFESQLSRHFKVHFPASTSAILTWVGLAANSATCEIDMRDWERLEDRDLRLIKRFQRAVGGGGLIAFDELVVHEANPEIWAWADEARLVTD